MYNEADTIAAIATPPGEGGIAILRISGPDAVRIASALFGRTKWESHRLMHGYITHAKERLDEAMAVLMQAPRSYTREDVVEFQCHGGTMTCQRVLEAALSLGARPAEPGEFTRRAYENGRIDLAQAEATMQLIGAQGESAARAALRQLGGAVSSGIRKAQGQITDMLAEIAACTDFPDEVEETPTAESLICQATALCETLRTACDARKGRVLDEGLSVVIAGRPNVGKSSLLNALLKEERAIVTAQPGTTRDAVHGSLVCQGVRINLTDTAGLRQADGEAEAIGIERARSAIESADLLLIVLDASRPLTEEDEQLLETTQAQERLVLINKSDLPPAWDRPYDLILSAQTGEGLESLHDLLAKKASAVQAGDALLTQARHIDAALRAVGFLQDMITSLQAGMPVDFAAVDAREALHALGEITGENAEESVVDAVFSQFCVGK